jgi:hypothetical protein
MKLPISDSLNQLFDVLDRDLTWLRIRWQMYEQLYASGALRIRLLNDSASTFFVDLQRILIDDMILGTCRMTDPAGSGKRRKATMKDLIRAVDEEDLGELSARLRAQLRTIESINEPLRIHRNKRIGHRDRKTALEPKKNPLPNVTIKQIDGVLKEIGEFLHIFQLYFGDSSTIYDSVTVPNDAEVLIERLKEGAVFNRMLRDDPITWYPKMEEGPFHDA